MTLPRLAAWFLAVTVVGPVAAQGFSPADAVKRMQLADGFRVSLVASEPMIRQPVSMTFDARGRMWVVQYLQYPTPAGLKAVSVDQYLRTKYDRVPEPPPKGPRGADRITILSDPDETGRYRTAKDFVTGLNLCTGMAIGHGGVFVMQAPYLLFYPDKNGDDVPDGDPEVLLSGFGTEDSHAYANSLQWGPDGWLYGAQGSTVTANVRGIEFQQGIWRYHPTTRQFELFAEGGGNTWGLDFDRYGNAIAGTNSGGAAMLHQVQGGYYVKGFGKHGPLHNPHTYGYFEHVPEPSFKGGHVTCGGVLYLGGAFPRAFDDTYIAANLLDNAIYWHRLIPTGSTFRAEQVGTLLKANDTWFRPIDCLVGPDGALYVADWYDKRANHVDPVDNWDRTNGRIYRIETVDAKPRPTLDLEKQSSAELVKLLEHANVWFRREARRLLAERRDAAIIPALLANLRDRTDDLALESLWALYVSGGFDAKRAAGLLKHGNRDVRAWTVRLLGDDRKTALDLASLARTEPEPVVRSQLACTAKRLPASQGLPIVRELLRRDDDLNDSFIPLLIWWAIEDKAISDRAAVLGLLDSSADWQRPLVQSMLLERIGRRYLAEGSPADLEACARLLTAAPSLADAKKLIAGMEQSLIGRKPTDVPPSLQKPLTALLEKAPDDVGLLRFALRLGSPTAYAHAVKAAADPKAPEAERLALIDVLGQIGRDDSLPVLLSAFTAPKPVSVRQAALTALQSYPSTEVTAAVLDHYPTLPGALQAKAMTMLLSRPASALEFLKRVDAGAIDKKGVPLASLQQAVEFKSEAVTKLIEKHWGRVGPLPAGEKVARIRALGVALSRGTGDPVRGKELFAKTCAACHQLFGEGNKIGPDLTSADRKNRTYMLTHIVDPSAVIRPEYAMHQVELNDGRVLAGLLVEQTPTAVTVLDAKNNRTVVGRDRIEEITPSPLSLMPEKLLDPFDDQMMRDLFAFMQADAPPAGAKKKLKVLLISGSLEYESDKSLAVLQTYLEKEHSIECLRAFRKTDSDIPGLEQLDACDVAILFTRRLTPNPEQLERLKKYLTGGKPVVGIRTASHAFQNWLELDTLVFGGSYKGHFGHEARPEVTIVEAAKDHPVLAGIKPFTATGGLYKNPSNTKDVTVLLTGTIPNGIEPVAWVRTVNGGRVFYTSLGHQDDFKDANFLRMIANAVFWTVGN